jgi:hypothetical protein
MSFLIWKTTSRGREVVGDIVGGSTRYCSPPSSCGSTAFAEPDSPRRGHKFDVAALFEIVPILHPFGFRTAGGCLRHRSHRPSPRVGLDARPSLRPRRGRPLLLPAPFAPRGVGLGFAPVGRWPHPTAGAPAWLLPRPLRQAGAKAEAPRCGA